MRQRFAILLVVGLGTWVTLETASEGGGPVPNEAELISAEQESCGRIAYSSDRDGHINIYVSPLTADALPN